LLCTSTASLQNGISHHNSAPVDQLFRASYSKPGSKILIVQEGEGGEGRGRNGVSITINGIRKTKNNCQARGSNAK